MDTLVKCVYILTVIAVCSAKDWHIKEDPDLKKKDNFMPFLHKYNSMPSPERERFVRHVEMTVTETVLEHLINEINKKYPETIRSGVKNSTMPKLIKKLKSKLRKQMKKNKMNKHKKMRNSKGRTTTTENTTKISLF